MTFKEWLIRHKGEDSPLGDLAEDVALDKDFPSDNSKEAILDHLTGANVHACREAIETFKRAWSSYRAYEKKHSE